MLIFDLAQIRHSLFRKGGKIRARVAGRTVPTIETETGRAGLVRQSEREWVDRMELQAAEKRRWQAVLGA